MRTAVYLYVYVQANNDECVVTKQQYVLIDSGMVGSFARPHFTMVIYVQCFIHSRCCTSRPASWPVQYK